MYVWRNLLFYCMFCAYVLAEHVFRWIFHSATHFFFFFQQRAPIEMHSIYIQLYIYQCHSVFSLRSLEFLQTAKNKRSYTGIFPRCLHIKKSSNWQQRKRRTWLHCDLAIWNFELSNVFRWFFFSACCTFFLNNLIVE